MSIDAFPAEYLPTEIMLVVRDHPATLWVVLGLLVVLPAGIFHGFPKPMALYRFTYAFPVIGPLRRYSALSRVFGQLSILLDMDCSLPEALRVVSGCSRCPAMRHSLLEAARGVELGDSPGEVLSRRWPFGAVARPLLNSADSGHELSLAIRETRELMDRQAEHYHALCLAVLPPAAVAVVSVVIVTVLFTTILPLL